MILEKPQSEGSIPQLIILFADILADPANQADSNGVLIPRSMVKTLKVLIDTERIHLKQEHEQNLAWENQFIRIEDQLRHAIAVLALRPEVVKRSYAAATGITTNTGNIKLVPAEIPDLAILRPG
ncbi:hypothetical protein PPACK8108_LOCUS12890 [Phakopsora pachyrhizi]|uniref:Uncharacterized protein n=1 Tax=Phakopsora pachyrhizi TaxID=170000 RepID=A0AAV0B530_PHAPC|nr:hypothetical protein PPACK8108_LOCUS12890 [Phakopsora pachyrhizi]